MTLAVSTHMRRGRFTLDVDLELPAEGVTAFFGRSGCGKTSLIRIIAGLDRVPGAEVRFRDQIWQQGRDFLPVSRRRIGLVFQEHSLLPHLSVKGNLLYGYKRTPSDLRRLDLSTVAELLEIGDLLERSIDQLSGGQRQRVSLGRALLASPQLLLLDEPLAALDTQTKREIMPFLVRLASEADVPIIMVSHASDEVERMADRVVFMGEGCIERTETLKEALARPDSPLFVDEGAASVLEGRIGAAEAHRLAPFDSGDVRLWVHARDGVSTSRRARLRILARDVSLATQDPEHISIQNHLRTTIERIDALDDYRVLVSTRLRDGQLLLAEVTRSAVERLGLQTGQSVYALIKSVALM